MEVKGRECEEVKIGGCTYYFVSEYKAKDFRKVLNSSFVKRIKVSQKGMQKLEMEMGELYEDMIPYLLYFCVGVEKNGSVVELTEEMVDSVSIEDFNKLIDKTVSVVSAVAGGEKKTLEQSNK